MRKAEIALTASLCALAVGMVGTAFSLRLVDRLGPGPGFTPLVVGIALLACALPLLVAALRRPEEGKAFLPERVERRRVLLVYGGTILTAVLIPVLGVRLVIPLFVAAMLRLLEQHPWPRTVSVAVGTGVFLYLVFELWLKVPLPAGLLGL